MGGGGANYMGAQERELRGRAATAGRFENTGGFPGRGGGGRLLERSQPSGGICWLDPLANPGASEPV